MRVYAKCSPGVSLISRSAWSKSTNLITFLQSFVPQMPLASMKSMLSGQVAGCVPWLPRRRASNSWVQVKTHRTIGDAVAHLKGRGMQILATHLSDKAVDFREIDYTRPTCILMGQEKTGITQEALDLADRDIIIPMIGMVQSLNVSVASALILYEAQRQRQNAGMYLRENSMLPEDEQQRLLFEGGYPVLAKVAKRKGLPYPRVNQQGEIDADADWWATMQAAG
ncbi:tRNA (guanosine-2'-O)-methyltransferase [Salmonella enterica subsp. enterica]|nr:tRNA (guanosine-2'-O)-methyltransferase [Salmonella enterica subsp. enterica]